MNAIKNLIRRVNVKEANLFLAIAYTYWESLAQVITLASQILHHHNLRRFAPDMMQLPSSVKGGVLRHLYRLGEA